MRNSNKGLRDYSLVTVVNIVCSVITFAYNIYMRRVIEPYELGVYTTVNLVISYLNYAQLGVLNSYNRDYPQLLGNGGKNDEANKLKNVTFTHLVIVFSILSVIAVIAGIMISRNDKMMGFGISVSGVIASTNVLYTFFDFTNKSQKHFTRSVAIQFSRTLLLIISGFFFLPKMNYYGIFLAIIISDIVMLVLNVIYTRDEKIHYEYDFAVIRNSLLSGFMLLTNSLAMTLMHSVDRFVILCFLSMEALGVYSVAMLGFNTISLIPQSLSQVFYINMSRLYGKTGDKKILLKNATDYSGILTKISMLVVTLAYYIIPVFVTIVMPKYADCVEATQIIILGVAIYGSTNLYGNILSVLKQNGKLLSTTIILCALNAILSTACVFIWKKDIASVALGTSISYIIYAGIMFITVHKIVNENPLPSLLRVVLPAVVNVIFIFLIERLNFSIYLRMTISLLMTIFIIAIFGKNEIAILYKLIKENKREE